MSALLELLEATRSLRRGKNNAEVDANIKQLVERAVAAGTLGEASPYYGLTIAEYRAVTA